MAYQEYRCVYGEEAEAALKFLFNAMATKADQGNPFQGIPAAIDLDNGPVTKSAVFRRVMESPGVEVLLHMPAGSDGRRTTARSKCQAACKRGSGSVSVQSAGHGGAMRRARRRSSLPRPYVWRRTSLSLVI